MVFKGAIIFLLAAIFWALITGYKVPKNSNSNIPSRISDTKQIEPSSLTSDLADLIKHDYVPPWQR